MSTTLPRFARTAVFGAVTLLLPACGAGGGGAGTASAVETAAPTLESVAAAPDVLLLDVRRPDEFASGHVEGAVNVPLGETARMMETIGAKDRPVVLHCRSGNRSGQALKALQAAGFTRLVNGGSYQHTASALDRPVVR
jgi:phage shock protein E